MTVTDEMIEAGAEALRTVPSYWTRFNCVKKDGFKYEICRYGVDKEPEIVVVQSYNDEKHLRVAQERIIRIERARAVLEAALAKDGEE